MVISVDLENNAEIRTMKWDYFVIEDSLKIELMTFFVCRIFRNSKIRSEKVTNIHRKSEDVRKLNDPCPLRIRMSVCPDCQIRLKKVESPKTPQSPRRSRSTAKTLKSDHDLFTSSIRKDPIPKKKYQNEPDKSTEFNYVTNQSKPKIRKAVTKQKDENPIWDEDGYLINPPKQNDTQNKQPENNSSFINPMSLRYLKKKENLQNRSIQDTVAVKKSPIKEKSLSPSPKARQRSASVQSPKKELDDSNYERLNKNDRSKQANNNSNKNPVQCERFMNEESKLIIKRANKSNRSITSESIRPKELPAVENEYSFKPDMSLTQKQRNVTGLSCKYSETKAVLKDIHMTASKIEQEAMDMNECTFAPELMTNPKTMEKAKKNQDRIMKRKKEKYREMVENIPPPPDEEPIPEYRPKKLPNRTKELNEIFKGLKNTAPKNEKVGSSK